MKDNPYDFEQLTKEVLSGPSIDQCYAVLGLNKSASIEAVRERAKELVRQWHPDQFKNDPVKYQAAVSKFAEFRSAYDKINSAFSESDKSFDSAKTTKETVSVPLPTAQNHFQTTMVNRSIFAEFWRRVVAKFVDTLVLVIPFVCIVILFGYNSAAAQALYGAILILYYAFMESSEKQATLGKMAVSIKVTDINGRRITLSKAIGRQFASLLCGVTLGVGYIIAVFSKRGQALHDMVAKCYVVNNEATQEAVVSCNIKPRLSAASIVLLILVFLPVPIGILAAIAIPQFSDHRNKILTNRSEAHNGNKTFDNYNINENEHHVTENNNSSNLSDKSNINNITPNTIILSREDEIEKQLNDEEQEIRALVKQQLIEALAKENIYIDDNAYNLHAGNIENEEIRKWRFKRKKELLRTN